MRVLITGSSGFVGPYLASELKHSGYEVFGYDRSGTAQRDIKTFKGDVLDKEQLSKVVDEVKPQMVFHLAAISSIKQSWQNPKLTKEVIVEGTKNLLGSIEKYDPKIIIVSSADVYATGQKMPLTEESEIKGKNPYSEARIEQEQICSDSDANIVISRSFNHTGPGQASTFVCPDLSNQFAEIAKGKANEISVGDVKVIRDFSDVRDVVRAYTLLAERGESGKTYNVCSGNGVAIKKILDILSEITGLDPEIKVDDSKVRKNEIMELVGDNSKMRKEVNWEPIIEFKTTLKDVYEYIIKSA